MRALCLALLLASAAAGALAAGKCIENPDSPLDSADDSLGFCKTCNADGTACQECWPGWSANTAGECVECTGSLCLSCNPADPGFCLECGDWSGESEVGYYALDNGTCAACPAENCMQCENGNGTCTSCTTGMGAIDGVCQPCKDQDGCIACDGNLGHCTECFSGYWLHKESGQCKRCPANCDSCSDSDTCNPGGCNPEGFTLDPAGSGKCVPCASEGCTQCSQGPDVCDSCEIGYTEMADKTCAKCSDKHCTTCTPGKPDECTICASTSTDPWFGGPNEDHSACVPCAAKNCAACQSDYRVCDWCEDGFFNDLQKGDCVPCAYRFGELCSWCGLDATQAEPGVPACFGCIDDYDLDDATGKCVKSTS
ncbi:hypothetical protein ABPG75_000292 [Micractinium tetrahymenae]